MTRLHRTSTNTTRRTAALVVVLGGLWCSLLAPAAAHAAPPAHAGPPAHTAPGHADAGSGEQADRRGGPPPGRGSERAPGQATSPGRSGEAPGRQPSDGPAPADPDPARPQPAAPGPSRPAPSAPAPSPPSPAPPVPPAPSTPAPAPSAPAAPAPPAPATSGPETSASAASSGTGTTTNLPAPTADASGNAAEAATPVVDPGAVTTSASSPSSFRLLRSTIEAATGTAERWRDDLAGSVGGATADAVRRLAPSLGAATAPEPPLPARDLGLPMGVLALLGGYLALSRWSDRGGLPMTVADGQEDDVQHVL